MQQCWNWLCSLLEVQKNLHIQEEYRHNQAGAKILIATAGIARPEGKKVAAANFCASGMQPFKAVVCVGLKNLLQAALDIGVTSLKNCWLTTKESRF